MTRTIWSIAALLVGGGLLMLGAWFDATVATHAQRQAAAEFNDSGYTVVWVVGSVLVGASCITLGWLAWRSSAIVDVIYVVVGIGFAALPWLALGIGPSLSGDSPPLAQSIASSASDVLFRTTGPLNAVGTMGAAMAIGGVAGLVRSLRRRRFERTSRLNSIDPLTLQGVGRHEF